MIKQHNTFILLNGYQINPKITQNILYSHGFQSQNTCFSFPNSRTAHHFLFLPKSYIDGPSLISYLHQSFLKIDLRRIWLIFFPLWICYLWKITIWLYIWLLGKNQWLIGYQISLIAIARQPKYHRFYALLSTHVTDWSTIS